MNKGQEAHMSQEMSGQQVQMNLGSARGQQQHQQLQVPSGHSGMDPQFVKMRTIMHRRIVDFLRERENAIRQSLEQLANRLENEIYRMHPKKADYYMMLKEPTEQLVRATVTVLSDHGHQRQKMLNQMQTSSIYGIVVPPLGMAHNTDAIYSDYWDPSSRIQQNSTASSISSLPFPVSMQRQVTHMIAAPEFRHQHTSRANPEYLNEALNGDWNVAAQVQQKQQKPFSVNQSTYPVQQPSNHVDSGVRSRMLDNSSSYDLLDPQTNGGMELHGSNVLLTNRYSSLEAFINLPPYCSYPDEALKQEFNLPTSSGISVSENVHNTASSALTSKRTNSGLFVSQIIEQQLQPKPCKNSEVLDGKEKVNFRKSKLSQEQLLERTHQGTMSQDLAQQPVSSDWICAGCSMNSIDSKPSKLPTKGPEQITENMKCYYLQLRWLLLLIHAKSCPGPLSSCKSQYCVGAQDVLKHFKNCQRKDCSYRYCRQSKMLICHYRNCVNKHCPVCSKAKESLHRYANQSNKRSHAEPTFNMEPYTIERVIDGKLVVIETFDDQPPVSKRIKQSLYPNVSDGVDVPVPQACSEFVLQKVHPEHLGQDKRRFPKQELNMKTDIRLPQRPVIINSGTVEKIGAVQSYVTPGIPRKLDSNFQDVLNIKNVDVLDMKNANGCTDVMLSKTGKIKRKGISLMEIFTPEQVYEHIFSLRQWVGQSKAKAEKNQAMGHSKNENSCQLCNLERRTFEPPPIYCSLCGSRIKRNAPYCISTINESRSGRYNFCVSCYTESRSEIFVGSHKLIKSTLEKRRNDDELEEAWVACDKCKRWQHQICALFNAKRNDEEKDAEFTCHDCYIQEIKHGLRAPLPQSTVLGAKDLPRTLLSNHIEERLFKRLKEERQDRAKKFGKFFDEVPGVEGLVVRVVSSVDKKLEVEPQFLEIFQKENYPTEFPYKSKAILLFQRIEGVEVCIFGMYVQEFGAECAFPNQRRVYLSYLDSVKYFRPEIETVSGEALRTFVYHEILIGYLQYCKQRGFTSCYIWACPPLKGEDYIMYCHPEIQKTPKSDKLREWYLSMLQKATKEGIVVERTNLYNHFFMHKGECKAKVTAACLPYFDGDYWPGAAGDILNTICIPEGDKNIKKNRKIKNIITKRDLKAAGVTDLSGSGSKDAVLMQKLGEFIYPMKEDFIMVHLQYSCSHCCILMVSGRRWKCNQCKSFYICDKCYSVEQQREDKERHPSNSTDLHLLHGVQIVGVPEDTKDRDDIIESEFFDTRQAFLSLCQGNHYQYDTLRSAKHSSMMVLYHLHNPTEPAFITTCNVCGNDIKTGHGWQCKECDYDECAACYQEHGGMNHVHRLTKHCAGADKDVQNIRQKHVQTARKLLGILTHAAACPPPGCQHPNCRRMKALFLHGKNCQQRVSGGCPLCKKLWGLIHIHVRTCKESQCRVPRCRDLKEHMRRLQQQSESRRRAAVNEMMRQRAAEAGVKVKQ